MTFIYFICFLLITVGVIILLRLNPEKITDDLMRFVSPKQTLREKVQTAKGKKRSRKLTVELNRIRDALEQTGKGGQFSIACAASVVLMIFGCILAIMIDNAFLIPVFAIAFAMIPFAYAKRTVNYYDNHIKEELETSLSIITTSYVRTDDIGILQFNVRNVVVATLDKIQFHSNLLGVFVYDFDLFIQSRVII